MLAVTFTLHRLPPGHSTVSVAMARASNSARPKLLHVVSSPDRKIVWVRDRAAVSLVPRLPTKR